jgi:DNA-binding transcriptional MerR regulator
MALIHYSVGQVAAASGVTIRTLHHYDEIGLLSPDARSAAGYRLYAEGDLERLQQILFYRELGFALEEIVKILKDRTVSSVDHLRRQHLLLTRRVDQLHAMIAALERELEAKQMGINLTPEERLEVFGNFPADEYAAEAEERWGTTDAWRESHKRTAAMTKEDWLQVSAESGVIEQGFVDALSRGLPPTSVEAMDLAEAHRQQITKWFYDCSYDIHVGLGPRAPGSPRFWPMMWESDRLR